MQWLISILLWKPVKNEKMLTENLFWNILFEKIRVCETDVNGMFKLLRATSIDDDALILNSKPLYAFLNFFPLEEFHPDSLE